MTFPFYWKDKESNQVVLFRDKQRCIVVTNLYFFGSKIEESRTESMLDVMEDNHVEATAADFANALVIATSRFETYYTPSLLDVECLVESQEDRIVKSHQASY